ncbi:MAG: hypothetical protein DGJ47_000059 [Rickettsiaceae bacterium]
MNKSKFVIIIPSRIGSTRLPRKPLAKIGEKSVIEHLIDNLKKFKDNLYIATDSQEIADVAVKNGTNPLMTGECATGSDRIYQAFNQIDDKENIKYVINIQGDMPFINDKTISNILERLERNDCDIVTAIAKIDADTAQNASNVKVVVDNNQNAMYFSRAMIPHGAKEFNYHVGVYGFKTKALEKFVHLSQTECEKHESLEQLRALENGMKIGVFNSDEIPISIDTPEDLKKAINYYNSIANS